MRKFKNFCRNYHRDIAYFFVGLILAFAISGIALNHRTTFNSRQYTYGSEPLKIELTKGADEIDEDYVKSLIPQTNIGNEYRMFRIQQGELRIFFQDALATIKLSNGEGQAEFFGRRYVLAEMADLHQTTNPAWVWYSDIFGIAMVFLAVTGMFIASGKHSFRKRGIWFSLVGLIFPLTFLFFLV